MSHLSRGMDRAHDSESPDDGLRTPVGSKRYISACEAIDRFDMEFLERITDLLNQKSQELHSQTDSIIAWNIFYYHVTAVIDHVVKLRRIPGVDNDDEVQEVWKTIIKRLPRYRFAADRFSFRGWLFVLVRNCVIDLQRSAARRKGVGLSSEMAETLVGREEEPRASQNPFHQLNELFQFIEIHAVGISSENIRIAKRYWIDGRSTSEIAVEMGMTESQVRDRNRRTMKSIRLFIRGKSLHEVLPNYFD